MQTNLRSFKQQSSYGLYPYSAPWHRDRVSSLATNQPEFNKQALFSPEEILWTKPEFAHRYKKFLAKNYQIIAESQKPILQEIEKLKNSIKDLGPKDLITDSETIKQIQDFSTNVRTSWQPIISFLNFLKSKEGVTNPELLNQITNDRKNAFQSVIRQYWHNLQSPMLTTRIHLDEISENLVKNQVSVNEVLPFIDSSQKTFALVNKFFDVLKSPSNKVKLVEVNIDEYFKELKDRYLNWISDKKITFNFKIGRSSIADFQSFTTDPELLDQIFDNVVGNAIEHLDENPDLNPHELNIKIYLDKQKFNMFHINVSNPTILNPKQIDELAKFKEGLSHKDGFSRKSKEHGIGLTSSQRACQDLGGDLGVYKDRNKPYFCVGMSVIDLKAN